VALIKAQAALFIANLSQKVGTKLIFSLNENLQRTFLYIGIE
jgi:hypothetical protein